MWSGIYILYSVCYHIHVPSENLKQKELRNVVSLIAVWDLNLKGIVLMLKYKFTNSWQLWKAAAVSCFYPALYSPTVFVDRYTLSTR